MCRLYSDSKAAASPCLARSIASASESLPCCFFASVKSSFPAASCQMQRKYLFVVPLAGTLVPTSSPAAVTALQQVAAYGLAGHSVRRVYGLVRYRIRLQVLASRFSLIISRFSRRKKGPKNNFGAAHGWEKRWTGWVQAWCRWSRRPSTPGRRGPLAIEHFLGSGFERSASEIHSNYLGYLLLLKCCIYYRAKVGEECYEYL